jgi:hypothetical protein
MMLRNSAALLVVLAATTLWGQSSGPSPVRQQPAVATSNAGGIAAGVRAKNAANQQLQEMGSTLTKMHMLLKQMRVNASKDPMAKANSEMWSLMLGELDKQYEQLSVAARQREDLEARRAALYKQADEKAAEAAKRAQEAKAAKPDSDAKSQTPAAAQPTATPAAPVTSPN